MTLEVAMRTPKFSLIGSKRFTVSWKHALNTEKYEVPGFPSALTKEGAYKKEKFIKYAKACISYYEEFLTGESVNRISI